MFSGDTISKCDLFNGTVEVEHILPLSKTLDDSFANKVLSTRQSNREKGNRTPFEAFGSSPSGYDWEDIGQRAAQLPASKRWRFEPDAMEQWEERGDFLDRQLNDTRYIARLGKTYVEALYGGQGSKEQRQQVWAVPGQLTSDLRYYAGFNNLTGLRGGNQKDRTDHRHHAVDALVIALTDRAMLQGAARLAKREDRIAHGEIMAEMAEPIKRYRKEAEDRLAKLTVSHKPDRGFQDAMHNETAYGLTGLRDQKGQQIVVTRKTLDQLMPKDLHRIADARIAEVLKDATDGLSGKAFTEALLEAAKHIGPDGIKKVRLHEPMSDKSLVIIHHGRNGRHVKAYKGDGNYCCDIWVGPNEKWTGEVITTYQAYQMAKADKHWWKKPVGRDGQTLVMRLRKGDMLELEKSNGERSAHIVSSFNINGRISLFEHFEANADGRTRASYKGDSPLKATFKAPSTLQKANAVRLSVSPTGTVRRLETA